MGLACGLNCGQGRFGRVGKNGVALIGPLGASVSGAGERVGNTAGVHTLGICANLRSTVVCTLSQTTCGFSRT